MRISVNLLCLLLVASLGAQPPRPVAHPTQARAPLLFVQFSGPPGVAVTFYQGRAPAREYRTPVVVGLRPGYRYRVKVTGFPERPGVELHPTLEVRGTLRLPPELPAIRHPAPIYFRHDDLERLLDGSVMTKIYYVEDPRRAVGAASKPDQPFEVELPPDRDLMHEARQQGRPLLVMRMGNRDVADEELRADSVPNTILFPGEKDVGLPRTPPPLAAITFPWYDPILGPGSEFEECIPDGGDRGEVAGIGFGGRLSGLDPEDTVAEYRDAAGTKKIAISNRVCLCVPRFAVFRSLLQLDRNRVVVRTDNFRRADGQVILDGREGLLGHRQIDHPADVIARQSPSQTEALMTTSVTGMIEGTRSIRARLTTANVTAVSREEPRLPERPLLLQKWTDRCDAEIGDLVTYTIKFSNQGGRPINDIVVSDSLANRLEYVPGTAQASRNAVFTVQPNEGGSAVLRWQLTAPLPPGESGVVRFQAKVR